MPSNLYLYGSAVTVASRPRLGLKVRTPIKKSEPFKCPPKLQPFFTAKIFYKFLIKKPDLTRRLTRFEKYSLSFKSCCKQKTFPSQRASRINGVKSTQNS